MMRFRLTQLSLTVFVISSELAHLVAQTGSQRQVVRELAIEGSEIVRSASIEGPVSIRGLSDLEQLKLLKERGNPTINVAQSRVTGGVKTTLVVDGKSTKSFSIRLVGLTRVKVGETDRLFFVCTDGQFATLLNPTVAFRQEQIGVNPSRYVTENVDGFLLLSAQKGDSVLVPAADVSDRLTLGEPKTALPVTRR